MNTNVVIIGQPNTGKSTLFNKIIGHQKAVTSPIAGTTRDTVNAETSWNGKIFEVYDTGGFEYKVADKDTINKSVQDQIQFALDKADIILFIVNLKTGVTAPDINFASKLKKIKRTTILVANKADDPELRQNTNDVMKLGLGQPQVVSGLTGLGIGDLLDKIASFVKKTSAEDKEKEEQKKEIRVGLFGKPNAGKSSIINALLGKNKVIVSDIPGTTRDTIENTIEYKDTNITLIDSAGIKRKRGARMGIEKFSVRQSLKTIQDCDTILFVLAADDYLSRQDRRIAERIIESHSSVIILINKIDLMKQKTIDLDQLTAQIKHDYNFLYFAPIIFLSAKTFQNVDQIFDEILLVDEAKRKIVDKETLTELLKEILKDYPPHRNKKTKKPPKLKRIIQFRTNPPKFNLYLEGQETIAPQYLRFLERKLYENYGFEGASIHISVVREESKKERMQPKKKTEII